MNKKLKKELEDMHQKLDAILDSSIVSKANKCDFYEQQLKNVKLKVSRIKPKLIETNIALTIEYEIEPVTIYLDDGNIYPNETFKSINLLNLISFEDMNKIQKKIEDIVLLQKNNK